MRRFIAATSIALLSLSAPVLAQSNMGMDASGRIDGTPPLGTAPGAEPQTGLVIPLDSIETGSVVNSAPSGRVDWARCPPRKARGALATQGGNSGASVSPACREGQ
ncbi:MULTISPECIES: hypothetical protein [Rhizobium]|uniref:Uncharacterized protein n=1 Tax=Rhizobium esperanzae TaxID=1967781 RepID=A0A246DT83_9HYPH|nr:MULTISPECIES: hypothetical protein [Rhizobium]ANK84859.1 hypothetical protein AMK02_CH01227 [Rhizobium sp. N731]ANK90740.1 hypothetical protein AMK01_CH01232 [Rhizobium sp. N6212]ANK96769.1 hypothetical protein AMK00_CH01234 [Rhizobium sp. N621]ANL02889.1 hypothetical protein AMJ99_CH01302 [Rhizobium esperanzae]ANL08938.1 hypothetical protein AMJ98_CH01223 [Rhizobium sp. N1341]